MQHERFCHRLGRRAGDRKTISPGTALRSCRTAYPALSSVSTSPGLSACQTRRPGTCMPSVLLRKAPATYAGAAPSPGTTAPGSRPSPADLPGPLRCQLPHFPLLTQILLSHIPYTGIKAHASGTSLLSGDVLPVFLFPSSGGMQRQRLPVLPLSRHFSAPHGTELVRPAVRPAAHPAVHPHVK